MKAVIYHNPRCSKSRQALALLEEAGADINVIEYLNNPPSEKALSALVKKLGVPAIDLVRTKEPEFKALGLSKTDSDMKLIAALTKEPKLIERPIVITPNGARIARPPELVKELL